MPQLTTDQYFHIGKSHLTGGKPCQDYAISGVHEDSAFAIITDGCSSGGHTDVGARLLALSTAVAVKEHWTQTRSVFDKNARQIIGIRQEVVLSGARQTFGLATKDMLATCAYAYLSLDGGFIHVQGDGVIATKSKNGCISMSRFDWENNTPFYPAYSETGLQSFIKAHGGILDAPRFIQESWVCNANGEFDDQSIVNHSLSAGMQGFTQFIDAEDDIELVAVFSDGVTQIEGVDWKEAVRKLMAFKNTAGEFAKRRMIREIKETQKTGKGPIDDIAFAVIKAELTSKES